MRAPCTVRRTWTGPHRVVITGPSRVRTGTVVGASEVAGRFGLVGGRFGMVVVGSAVGTATRLVAPPGVVWKLARSARPAAVATRTGAARRMTAIRIRTARSARVSWARAVSLAGGA